MSILVDHDLIDGMQLVVRGPDLKVTSNTNEHAWYQGSDTAMMLVTGHPDEPILQLRTFFGAATELVEPHRSGSLVVGTPTESFNARLVAWVGPYHALESSIDPEKGVDVARSLFDRFFLQDKPMGLTLMSRADADAHLLRRAVTVRIGCMNLTVRPASAVSADAFSGGLNVKGGSLVKRSDDEQTDLYLLTPTAVVTISYSNHEVVDSEIAEMIETLEADWLA